MRVHFQPQAWVNDYATDVDDQGNDVWDVTDETAKLIRKAFEDYSGGDLDFVVGDDNTPQWVRDWSGPFCITVVEDEETDDERGDICMALRDNGFEDEADEVGGMDIMNARLVYFELVGVAWNWEAQQDQWAAQAMTLNPTAYPNPQEN